KYHENHEGQKRRDRALGQSCGSDEEVEVEEPEFAIGLIPGVPPEHADAEWGGHLHVCRRAASETENPGTGSRDQGRVELASASKAADVQVDQSHENECEAGRRQARRPVMDAELPK